MKFQLWRIAQKRLEYYLKVLKTLALSAMKMEMCSHRQVMAQLVDAKQVPVLQLERRNELIDQFISSSTVKKSRQQIQYSVEKTGSANALSCPK